MKTVLFLAAAFAAGPALSPLHAAIFRPETVRGAALGGVAGAIIGHNAGRHGWEGAAYGAVAGGLIGSAVANTNDRRNLHPAHHHRAPYYRTPTHYRTGWSSGPRWSIGYTHSRGGAWGYPGHWGHRRGYGYVYPRHARVAVRPAWAWPTYRHRFGGYGYRASGYGYRGYRGYGYRASGYGSHGYPVSYATRGALLGGVLGAVIGHNDGRHGWEGAAYGAGAGYLFGSLADARSRQDAAVRAAAEEARRQTQSAATAAPAQVTIINNYYSAPGTPMSAANGLFGR